MPLNYQGSLSLYVYVRQRTYVLEVRLSPTVKKVSGLRPALSVGVPPEKKPQGRGLYQAHFPSVGSDITLSMVGPFC
jgi:hypothetical protein